MPVSFNSSGSLQFSTIGLTQSLSGITLSTTIYDTVSGATFQSAIVPTGLNYVLGTVNDGQSVSTTAFAGVSFGTLSLTTQSTRIVEIGLLGATINGGCVNMTSPDTTNVAGFVFKLLRGPSTIINEIQSQASASDNQASMVPATSFKWMDFTPPSGGATYILQCKNIGASTLTVLNQIRLFVRQI